MDNLIEILRDALQARVERPGVLRFPVQEYQAALSLLSDRSALLWALLEEMAGEVVVEDAVTDCGYRYKRFFFGGISWCKLYAEGGLVKAPRNPVEGEGVLAFSACLARAIQEQRKREAGVPNG